MDDGLLTEARARLCRPDSELLDEALRALLARERSVEIDEAYAVAYAAHPVDEPDDWGDLTAWADAAVRSR